MSCLVLEPSTIDRLKAVETEVEVRDSDGKLIGFFVPAITADDVDHFECPISEEELLRRASSGDGRALSDVLTDLRGPS